MLLNPHCPGSLSIPTIHIRQTWSCPSQCFLPVLGQAGVRTWEILLPPASWPCRHWVTHPGWEPRPRLSPATLLADLLLGQAGCLDQVCTLCITQPRPLLGPPLHLCSHQPPYKVNVATFWVAVATTSNIEWPNRTDKNSQEVGAGNGVHRWGSMQAAPGLSDLLLTTQLIPRSWRARATIFPSPPPSWALGGMEIIPPSCFPACAADRLQHCRLPTCLRRNRTKTSSAEAEGKEPALYFFKGYWRLE